ncbi:unnamed protein product [Malus baccata var. baccata]
MAAVPAAPKLMHAVQYNCYGGGASGLKNLKVDLCLLLHVNIPIPAPKRDEVCMKLEAASLNPSDWKVQKGIQWPFFPGKLPHIPVNDVAGEIIEVGQGFKKFKAIDKVVALLNLFNGGGLAEFSVASERLTVARPPEVSATESAGLPIAGLTALQALTQAASIKLDGSGQQKNILITAASGGVGHYAVQLAKLGNTHVTDTCGARNVELEIGIPWSTFEPNLSAEGKVIDISVTPSALLTLVLNTITFSKKQLNLEYLVKWVKEGKLKTVIDSKYALSKAEDAWAKSTDGHATGKIIVEP